MLAVLGVGWFAGHASAASYIYSNGVWIRIGSIECLAEGTGSLNLKTDEFVCKVNNVFANVLCVNPALNNGNPDTASVQLDSVSGFGTLQYFDRDKKRYWAGATTIEVNDQVTNDLCVNPGWNVVYYYPDGTYPDVSKLEPVYAIAGMDVTVSIQSCKTTTSGTTCTTRTSYDFACGPINPVDGTPVYDATFNTVTLLDEEVNGTRTATWGNPPQPGDSFGCVCKDPNNCPDAVNEGDPPPIL
jgi:hypothetical protein